MFHVAHGLSFQRVPGGVRVEKREADGRVVLDQFMDYDAFASVVASMSVRGENYETWSAARDFLTNS